MTDWLSSMQQTFEYYIVDPGTWKDRDRLVDVKSCSITRDLDTSTLGSATIDVTNFLGECYIRVYLITLQNGVKEKHPLGTFLVQTPSTSFTGLVNNVTMDGYTPLIELKEGLPPLGFYSPKDTTNIMAEVCRLTKENLRAPVIDAEYDKKLDTDFISNTDDTWLSYISDLMAGAKYRFDLDEMGRIMFAPHQDVASLQPVWTYEDDEKSIIYHDITLDRDFYGIPNVVEVICSYGSKMYNVVVENNDSNSPLSIQNRGRRITHRVTDPGFVAPPTTGQVELYAKQLLRDLSSVEYTISYSHAYNGTRLGDCVRFNLNRFGLTGIKGKIISQTIKCTPGCPVSEKAVYTTSLWGDSL